MSYLFDFAQPQFVVLLISILAFFLGPALLLKLQPNSRFHITLDGFSLTVVIGLVLIHIFPHAAAEIGWKAAPMAALGLLLPSYFEKRFTKTLGEPAHMLSLIVGLSGFVLHEFTDGLVLVTQNQSSGFILALAIIIHRLPLGIVVWTLIAEKKGKRLALLTLGAMSAATILGYTLGQQMQIFSEQKVVAYFQALAAGAMLHAMFHQHHHVSSKKIKFEGFGALIGLFTLVLIHQSGIDPESHANVSQIWSGFLHMVYESAPSLILAYVAAGLIYAYFPQTMPKWFKAENKFDQAFRGMAFGLPLPVCSCGVIPLYRSLTLRCIPLAAGIAFFTATPEMGIDSFLLSVKFSGLSFALIRLASAGFVALSVGFIIGTLYDAKIKKQDASKLELKTQPCCHSDNSRHSEELAQNINHVDKIKIDAKERVKKIIEGVFENVDHTAPWIVFGILIAAIVESHVDLSLWISHLGRFLQIPVFAIIGMPLYVCASGITPLIGILLAKGLTPGAAMALLITGPASNISTYGVLKELHGRKIALSFIVTMIGLAVFVGCVVNYFAVDFSPQSIMHNHSQHSVYGLIGGVVIFILYVAALLRRGPRALINQVIAFQKEDKHEH